MEKIFNPSSSPPHLYMAQVLEHCPRAGSTYLKIWREKNKDNRLVIEKKDFRKEQLVSLTVFKNDLISLVREGLISFEETPDLIYIELVDWDAS